MEFEFERAICCAYNGVTLTFEQKEFLLKHIHFTEPNEIVALKSSTDFATQLLNESATSSLPGPHSKMVSSNCEQHRSIFQRRKIFFDGLPPGAVKN